MAIELFAWAILKFQNVASSVRFGLYRTLLEEQTHLRMYLFEMKKGGMELGDRPLNSIFLETGSENANSRKVLRDHGNLF